MNNRLSIYDRFNGAAAGAYIGDALAMPAHWYYDQKKLQKEFGRITSFRKPPGIHTGSFLWRSSYEPEEKDYDILGSQRKYWGVKNIHYHQFLEAGENTLNLKLLRLALGMASELGGYDRDTYISLYMKFMLHPDEHRDTYIEECHRGFFINLKKGVKPEKCAIEEKHIGGMVHVIPLYAKLRSLGLNQEKASSAVHEHVSVTHRGEKIRKGVNTLIALADEIIDGNTLEDSLKNHLEKQDLEYLTGKIASLISKPDLDVLGPVFSVACYLDDSLPASFYLALKYSSSPKEALIQNTMAGGDNCHRGAVIGALLGLAGGESIFPSEWRENPAAAENNIPLSGKRA
ncbi:MAG: ADP-ribosylglycohydrolase family protein [Spirochaetia bacterium]|jgi:ADP-ribosylglycohydrolase|nr:ADP-ribosylglycohydrolase family protein [Spirochaetia bacterium]